jgi:hypothetical protein
MSVQPPSTVAAPLSGPWYVSEAQLAMPEVASVPLHRITTGRLYQPLWSGGREALAVMPVGAVASILIKCVTAVVDPSRFCAAHVSFVPVVGPGIVMAGEQLVAVASSDTDQWRTTLLPLLLPRYQPLVPEIPVIE